MVTVTLEDIRKEFGSVVAVESFDLTIEENEFITLVGPSGCGKTTTLRILAGLETPTSGRITFGDQDVTRLPPQERDIALLFQEIALYPHMSVRENMAYGLKIAGMASEERNRKVEEVADLLQISDQLDSKPSELSGGQQQRVALGRSMVRDPSVFLFDEPMSDLDAKLKRELRPLFEEVTRDIGCPTLYVTHDQEEAMTMSDRIVVMNNGRIEQIGTPTEIYNAPANEFVAGFMGQPTMQFIEGELVGEGESASLRVQDHTVTAPELVGDLEPGRQVRIGIRPHDISVGTNGSGIPATHALDEPLGNETHSFFDGDFGRITVVTDGAFRGNGDQYSLSFDPTAAKLFDAETGERLA